MSELYAAVLMIGLTLSMGSLVVAAATSQFGSEENSASLGTSLQQGSEVQVGLIYSVVSPSGTCPTYRGSGEATALTIAIYDYGTTTFTPTEIVDNATLYSGGYGTVASGSLGQFTVTLGSCAHSSGQTILAFDSAGDEVQLGT